MGKQITVPHNTPDRDMEEFQSRLQVEQERVRRLAEENVRRVGSSEFPATK
jgi:hypothetical protein